MKILIEKQLNYLAQQFEGAIYYNATSNHQVQLLAYSTDASVYQEKPLAVAIPKSVSDIQLLISFANQHNTTLIPRAAGTSLAGQVVGNGIVVDISKHFNQIIEVSLNQKWVRVQPGVIRDDLNHYLKGFGLMFGPETSTANRAMIGGMVGNNSCGLHSIVWGDVRTHLLEVTVLLSDGSEAVISRDNIENFQSFIGLKATIYKALFELLIDKKNQQLIHDNYFQPTSLNRAYLLTHAV